MRIRRIRKLILDIFHEMFEALKLPGVDRLKVDSRDDCPIMHKVKIVGANGKKYWIWAMPDDKE